MIFHENIVIKKFGNSDEFIIICDHSSNYIPDDYKKLGVSDEYLESHRAYDLGVSQLAKELSQLLDCHLVMANFSRLLIDPNRGEDDPTLIPKISEGEIIYGNLDVKFSVKDKERNRRIREYYVPYHNQINDLINAAIQNNKVPKIISIHSFTPVWKGKGRDIEVGILWDKDDRLSQIFLKSLKSKKTADNKPYNGRLKNDTMFKHGTSRGLPHVLIELRQDLLNNKKDRLLWAKKIYNVLKDNEKIIKMFSIKNYGSNTI